VLSTSSQSGSMLASEGKSMETRRRSFSIAEIAFRHGLSKQLVRADIKRGVLKAKKIGRRTIVTEEAERAWLDAAPSAGHDAGSVQNG
jgi:hypothetical protein